MKTLISKTVANKTFGRLFDATIVPLYRRVEWERIYKPGRLLIDNAIDTLVPDLKVRHGAFKGMKYAGRKSLCSTIFPKLLGSYECELEPVVEQMCQTNYTEVLDIGCAEGYYAIGFALRIPGARVFAYDIDEKARELCGQMAELNNVRERLTLGAFCSPETLLSFNFTGRGLLISDCEAYEKDLFTEEVVAKLAGHDVLIEVHDYLDIEISTVLRRRFEKTHSLQVILSLDDLVKARTYSYEELDRYDTKGRHILVSEGRPGIMEWYFFSSRQYANVPDSGVGKSTKADRSSATDAVATPA